MHKQAVHIQTLIHENGRLNIKLLPRKIKVHGRSFGKLWKALDFCFFIIWLKLMVSSQICEIYFFLYNLKRIRLIEIATKNDEYNEDDEEASIRFFRG